MEHVLYILHNNNIIIWLGNTYNRTWADNATSCMYTLSLYNTNATVTSVNIYNKFVFNNV